MEKVFYRNDEYKFFNDEDTIQLKDFANQPDERLPISLKGYDVYKRYDYRYSETVVVLLDSNNEVVTEKPTTLSMRDFIEEYKWKLAEIKA